MSSECMCISEIISALMSIHILANPPSPSITLLIALAKSSIIVSLIKVVSVVIIVNNDPVRVESKNLAGKWDI